MITIWVTIRPRQCINIAQNDHNYSSQLKPAQPGVYLLQDWSGSSAFGGGEHGQMRRAALNNDELPFDAMITNNNDWKLVVLIVVNFCKSQNIYYD